MDYTILKALHLLAVISWCAGLLYIGRLFVYFSESNYESTKQTLATMAKNLSRGIILPAGIISTLIGLHMAGQIQAFSMGWFHLKLTLLILLFGYQHVCAKYIKQCHANTFKKSAAFCRRFNEVPIVLITGILFAVITKNIQWAIISMVTLGSFIVTFFLIKKK